MESKIEQRARKACRLTYDYISDDLAKCLDHEPTSEEIADAIGDYGTMYGKDKEAIDWLFETFGYENVWKKIKEWGIGC